MGRRLLRIGAAGAYFPKVPPLWTGLSPSRDKLELVAVSVVSMSLNSGYPSAPSVPGRMEKLILTGPDEGEIPTRHL